MLHCILSRSLEVCLNTITVYTGEVFIKRIRHKLNLSTILEQSSNHMSMLGVINCSKVNILLNNNCCDCARTHLRLTASCLLFTNILWFEK